MRFKTLIALVACTTLTLFGLEADAAIYKWVDAQGNTQFSDQPPGGSVEATKVATPGANISEGRRAAAQQRRDALKQISEARQEKRSGQAKEKEESLAAADTRRQQCDGARVRVALAEQTTHTYTVDANGERQYQASDQRDAEIRQMRADVERYCS